MKNTFYRPAEVDVNVFEKIVEKLHQDLEMLISGKVSDEEVIEYVRGIIHHAKPYLLTGIWYFGDKVILDLCLLTLE